MKNGKITALSLGPTAILISEEVPTTPWYDILVVRQRH